MSSTIGRLEVVTGPGVVMRYGDIVVWASHLASPHLLNFLKQSATNLHGSDDGGRLLADHVERVLLAGDPEPNAAFGCLGPSQGRWTVLLHGPVRLYDGSSEHTPSPQPGWLRLNPVPMPAIAVVPLGSPLPPYHPDSALDLGLGTVPGGAILVTPPASDPVPPPQAGAGSTGQTTVQRAPAMTAPGTAPPAAESTPETEPTPGPPEAPAEPHEDATDAPDAQETESDQPAPSPRETVDLRGAPAPWGGPLPEVGVVPPADPSRLVVRGRNCDSGHFNDPDSQACEVCGADLTARPLESGGRPALGALIAEDGTSYQLDRGFLIGSDPTSDPAVRGGRLRPVMIKDDEGNVAPTHAEIRLTDWQVAVIDRGSPAGTFVVEPGSSDWKPLQRYQPFSLESGMHLALGGKVFTYVSRSQSS